MKLAKLRNSEIQNKKLNGKPQFVNQNTLKNQTKPTKFIIDLLQTNRDKSLWDK